MTATGPKNISGILNELEPKHLASLLSCLVVVDGAAGGGGGGGAKGGEAAKVPPVRLRNVVMLMEWVPSDAASGEARPQPSGTPPQSLWTQRERGKCLLAG